ncbi:MAG TPA: dipeptide ABC transporter ATP-binding protein [Acetobacteraceae bacterium]|nr:dipeptide ABC transporter ATP-binding protein [Acetobacteraceae bacterium]
MSQPSSAAPVLQARHVSKIFAVSGGLLHRTKGMLRAVDDVSFAIGPGETLCIVGESGCGKSTLGRLALRLIEPSGGQILIEGCDVTALSAEQMRPFRRRVQMVFQDPYASLNPRLSAQEIVTEPIENYQPLSPGDRRERAADLLTRVGLRPDMLNRRPFEFSGGQRQRLGIARALSLHPALIVADEPVSALDVSVQAQVLNLMLDLQESIGIAYLFISHDLGVVEHIGQRIAVMYLGRIVELADRDALFSQPQHPYTEALLQAAPVPDPRVRGTRPILEGELPSPIAPPPGCTFHPRCPYAIARCRTEVPALRQIADGRLAACHLR